MPHRHVETSETGFVGQTHPHHEQLKVQRLNDGLPADRTHYLLAAFGELEPGNSIPAVHPGPTVVYVIEGEIDVVDNTKPGEITKLRAGDVIHFEEGTANVSAATSKARFFGVSYVPSNLHPEDLIVKKH